MINTLDPATRRDVLNIEFKMMATTELESLKARCFAISRGINQSHGSRVMACAYEDRAYEIEGEQRRRGVIREMPKPEHHGGRHHTDGQKMH